MTVADFCKWVARLKGLPASDQALAIRLAEQANEDLVIDGVDWELLFADSGLGKTAARQKLRPGSVLVDGGYVIYEPRTIGKMTLPTLYRLNLEG